MIFDGAHNPQGIEAAVESIKLYFKNEKVCFVTGVLADKDYSYIAKKLSEVSRVAFTFTPDSPRALDATDYAKTLFSQGVDAISSDSVCEALNKAREYAKANESPIICAGSLYAYADIIKNI